MLNISLSLLFVLNYYSRIKHTFFLFTTVFTGQFFNFLRETKKMATE